MPQPGFFDLDDRFAKLDGIGVVRARFKIGMMNLAYNLRRLAWLKASRRAAMA